jgi:hypothetical protein
VPGAIEGDSKDGFATGIMSALADLVPTSNIKAQQTRQFIAFMTEFLEWVRYHFADQEENLMAFVLSNPAGDSLLSLRDRSQD